MKLNTLGNGIDWAHAEATALELTTPQLHAARLDAAKTARELGGVAEGYYTDLCSVYDAEMRARMSLNPKALARRAAKIRAAAEKNRE